MATATSVFMVLTFGGSGYASSIATSIRLSTFSSVRSTARAGPRGWHAVRSEPSLERPRIMIGASADHGGARPHTTPKLALYYCRLAQQKLLNDQAVAILYDVFERRAADKAAKVAARRAAIKPVS